MAIWVIDFKSSSGIWPEYHTQVSCYFKMYGKAEKAGILRLDKETGMPDFAETIDIDTKWEAFLHLREYFRLMIEPGLSEKKMERWYKADGKKVPTITTILDLLNKPALPQWAANSTIDYIRWHLPEMNSADQIEYHLSKAKTFYRQVGKKAMDTGSVVHDAIHAYLSGVKPETIIGDNEAAQNAFLAFLEWADKVQLKPIELEKVLIDPVNEVGGTCDFIGSLSE